MASKSITVPAECTGCALCANVCSSNAIRMVWNSEGFLIPQVDTQTCINCGACVRACPAQLNHLKKLRSAECVDAPLSAYGAWHRDKNTLLSSSSGGVFSALAARTFAKGGCVFGVVWTSKDNASYAKAENMDELAAMRGSKYTQAQPGMVYRRVKTELQKGRLVLFCGTSCQVYALRCYLRKDYENLLLIDILCHGVPSRNLLKAYIRHYEKAHGKELESIQFRDKANNWQMYCVKKIFSDGSTISHCNREDMFMRLFIGDFVLNEACYNCPHTKLPRVGDVTLGDFWGNLQQLHPEWPIPEGIGSVLGNTQKGQQALEQLTDSGIIHLKAVPFEELLQGQPYTYLRDKEPVHSLRREALTMLKYQRLTVIHERLLYRVKCGRMWLKRNSFAHKIYQKLRRLKYLLHR